MFIPIIIPPIYNYDDDRKHGIGCRCPECLQKEEWDNKPREYYKERYAVPKSFIIKIKIIKIFGIILLIVGTISIFSPIIFFNINQDFSFIGILLSTVFGFIINIFGFVLLINKKEPYKCKNNIKLESKYFSTKEDWDKVIKENNIPKNYKLTKEETKWRYKI